MAHATIGTDPSVRKKRHLWTTALPMLAPLFFVVTTIIGAIRWFSPVPFWDMWDGTLQFYIERLQGDRWSPFFEQANEHRIVLSKILFWIDYRFFGGLSHFLITINIVLMFALWATLFWAARLLLDRRLSYLCGALSGVLCFSWLQYENINWGYQSQFYLAYLLPLLALISMACWIREPNKLRFAITLSLGVLSTVTMANGLFALPLLGVMLLVSGKNTRCRMGTLLLVMALTFAAWSYHYQVPHHPSATLGRMLGFLLLFLGGPFQFIFQEHHLTVVMGGVVICAGAYLALRWIIGERDPLFLALVLFVVYVGAAAAAATLGRAYFGFGAALAGRYETPILLLYSTLLLVFSHLYRNKTSTRAVVGALSVFTPILLFTPQMGAFSEQGPTTAHERLQIVLALDLGVKDDAEISKIYLVDHARLRANDAIRYGLSVFALPSMRSARESIGKSPASLGLAPCQSFVDSVNAIATDSRYVSVKGWAFDSKTQTIPANVFFVANGVVTGVAVTGGDRPDVQQAFSKRAFRAGFDGYALNPEGQKLAVYCQK